MGVKSGRFIVIAGFFLLVFVLSPTAKTALAAPAITSPAPDSTLECGDTLFAWRPFGTSVIRWGLHVGTTPGGHDIINAGNLGSRTTYTLSGKPEDGSTIYARLWYEVVDTYTQQFVDFQYTAASDCEGVGGTDCGGSWSKVIPNSDDRFDLVMGGAGVLDKETCLVWEQSPITTEHSWYAARGLCYRATLGGRKGWRLPTIEELESLVDNTQWYPALPSGHPFFGVINNWHWSSTHDMPVYGVPSLVWVEHMGSGSARKRDRTSTRTGTANVWCVRGGHSNGW